MMITINKFLRKGTLAPAILRQAKEIVMTLDERRRARQKLSLADGQEIGIFIERGTVLQDGDILLSDDNRFFIVRAAAQELMRVTAPNSLSLMRAAYHLGNRHISLEVGSDYLHFEPDPVLAQMLHQLGVSVSTVQAPFLPETGAYGGGHKHGHDETYAEDYTLAQQAYHAHDHDYHGHDCGHDHSHEHGANHKHTHRHSCNHPSHQHTSSCGHKHTHGHDHAHEHPHSHDGDHDHTHDHGHAHHTHQHGDKHS